MLTETEIKIAKYIQGDIPLVKRPFEHIGIETGMGENEVIEAVNSLLERGIIRKIGAVIRHQKAGFTQNAMVVWAVPGERCEAVGNIFATFKEITHCYERNPPLDKKYNLFTMIHLRENDQKEFSWPVATTKHENPPTPPFSKGGMGGFSSKLIEKLSSAVDIGDFKVLISEREFKKSSMTYF